MNISKSEAYFERSKKVSPGGVHSPVRAFRGVGGTPRFVERAEGAELIDVDGNRYVDFCMSWGPLILGHQDRDVMEAVQSALHRGWSYGTCETYSLELAEFMTETLPWVQKVRFVNSGTEAVMSALRVARAATGRSKILKFDGCYHGHVDSMLVRSGSGLAEMASPDSAGVSASTAADTIVAPLDDLATLNAIFEKHHNTIAAVIIEPLPANNGLLPQRQDFLKQMMTLAQSHGALVIMDEVISGFRVGYGGMCERLNIRPDLVTYGKIIGGGFPVGAFGGRKDLMDQVAPSGSVYQAGTLSGNPIAMVAGLAMLKKLKNENPYPRLTKNLENLAKDLSAVSKKESKTPISLQFQDSLFWSAIGEVKTQDGIVRRQDQIPSTQKEGFSKLFHALLSRGVYLAPSGFEVGFLSTVHTPRILERFVEAYQEALKEIKI